MVSLICRLSFLLLLMFSSVQVAAVIEINEFSSEEVRARYQSLIEELRCPKCQNQNLAGSDSSVSVDLRREVLMMLEQGNSDSEIRAFMRDRYGDFILYNPPAEGKTLFVWVVPPILLFFGVLIIVMVVRGASKNAAEGVVDDYEPIENELEGNEPEDEGKA